MNLDEKVMKEAIKKADETMRDNIGGPFGAAIINKDSGEIICIESNSVLRDNDPTAHAEINAIRNACKKLNTYDLNNYILYATGYPCPMCMSAIIWANIKEVVYCNTIKEAEDIGFRDDFIQDFIKDNCIDENTLKIRHISLPDGKELYDNYKKLNKVIY